MSVIERENKSFVWALFVGFYLAGRAQTNWRLADAPLVADELLAEWEKRFGDGEHP